MGVRGEAFGDITLAGEERERLKGFARERFGRPIPNQFCAFVGRCSLLEYPIKRARLLIPPERLIASGTAHHESYPFQTLGTSPPGRVLLQPADRETAPDILLPLRHILRKDQDALVTILPADHFVLTDDRFMDVVTTATKFAADMRVESPISPDGETRSPGPGVWVDQAGEGRGTRRTLDDSPDRTV